MFRNRIYALALTLAVVVTASPSPAGAQAPPDAALVAKAHAIHDRVIALDTHNDINPRDFTPERNYTQRLDTQVNIPKMVEGGLDASFFIVYVGQGPLTPEGYDRAYKQAVEKFDAVHRLTEQIAPDKIGLALTAADVRRIAASGRKVALIGVENAYSLGTDISRVKEFYDRGARYMSLAHNGNSQFADSNTSERDGTLHNGLSPLGRRVIAEMNRLGIMVDLSHPSKEANMQAIELSKAPVIASHSAARALADVSRNLDDEQLAAIRRNGGVVQAVAFDSYMKVKPADSPERAAAIAALRKELGMVAGGAPGAAADAARGTFRARMAEIDKKFPPPPMATVSDFADHIDYLVKKLGIDHVGIASDFDGGGGVKGWNGADETFNVTLELVKRGYTEEQIGKIWSGNLLRVMDEVQQVARKIQGRQVTPELQEAIDFHHAVIAEGSRALVGYDTAKAVANVVLLSEIPTTYDKRTERQVNAGNLLLRGVPGVGKTFFGVILAAISDAKFARLQGRADLQPTEVVGFQMINPSTGQLVTEFGPMASAEVILLDEINRIPLKSQSAFLEALQDRTITVGKTTYDLPAFSFAIATMNPVELGQGTFPLSEAATDRFAAMINIGYLSPEEEERLVNFDFKHVTLRPLLSKHRIIELRSVISDGVFLHDSLARYIQRLVAATRPYNADTDWRQHSPSELVERGVDLGASPRAIICWSRLAKVWALLQRQRAEVYPEDIQDLAPFVLGHRLWLGPHAAAHGLTVEDVIKDVIAQVPVP